MMCFWDDVSVVVAQINVGEMGVHDEVPLSVCMNMYISPSSPHSFLPLSSILHSPPQLQLCDELGV